jgi:hypothetical protein
MMPPSLPLPTVPSLHFKAHTELEKHKLLGKRKASRPARGDGGVYDFGSDYEDLESLRDNSSSSRQGARGPAADEDEDFEMTTTEYESASDIDDAE